MTDPLCGWPWYKKHRNDYSQAYINSLTIQISNNGTKLSAIPNTRAGKRVLKEVLTSYTERKRKYA